MENKHEQERAMETLDVIGTENTEETAQNGSKVKRASRPAKPFPSYSLEEALKIPQSIAQNNAGNPWGSDQIATAVGMSHKSSVFYYFTTASRDYGMTTGTGRGKTMELTALGRKMVYPVNSEEESAALQQAFFNIDIFQKVYDYYKVVLSRRNGLCAILFRKPLGWMRFITRSFCKFILQMSSFLRKKVR